MFSFKFVFVSVFTVFVFTMIAIPEDGNQQPSLFNLLFMQYYKSLF